MSKVVVLLISLFSVFAQAQSNELFYSCDLTVQSKDSVNLTQERRVYLSNVRYSEINLTSWKTELSLKVDYNGNLDGSVNKQRRFLLTGNSNYGVFESAYATGTIRCSEGQKEASMLVRKPGTLVKQTDLSKNLFDRLSYAGSAYLYCFLGKAEAAAEQLQATLAKTVTVKVKDVDTVELSQPEVRCQVRDGVGYPGNAGECLKWSAPTVKTYTLSNCNPQNDGDNR